MRASIASIDFNWQPQVVEADDPQVFKQTYVVTNAMETRSFFLRIKFADLPSAGIWADYDEEVLGDRYG